MRIRDLLQASGFLASGALLVESLDSALGACRSGCRQSRGRVALGREFIGHTGQIAAMARGRFADRPRLRFRGSADSICRQVIEHCWNGRFFATGLGHYPDVWIRDLGLCAESLIRLGYRNELGQTLAFVLEAYTRSRRVTTVVRRSGYAQDIYGEPADAFPLLLRSLVLLGDRTLAEHHRGFLEAATHSYLLDHGVHPKEGFKDTVVRKFSTYDVMMVDVALHAAATMGIAIPRAIYQQPERSLAALWRHSHFAAVRDGDDHHFSADAAILPFVLTDVTTGDMVAAALAEIRDRRLDEPFPLVFSDPPHFEMPRLLPRLMTPGYQEDTIWSIFGALIILLARRSGQSELAERYARAYASSIEESGTFYELFSRDGTPYQSWCYRSCEGMLWAAIYLDAVTAAF